MRVDLVFFSFFCRNVQYSLGRDVQCCIIFHQMEWLDHMVFGSKN